MFENCDMIEILIWILNSLSNHCFSPNVEYTLNEQKISKNEDQILKQQN
jgi:hypothetical protein